MYCLEHFEHVMQYYMMLDNLHVRYPLVGRGNLLKDNFVLVHTIRSFLLIFGQWLHLPAIFRHTFGMIFLIIDGW